MEISEHDSFFEALSPISFVVFCAVPWVQRRLGQSLSPEQFLFFMTVAKPFSSINIDKYSPRWSGRQWSWDYSTLFFQPEAAHLGDLLWLLVRPDMKIIVSWSLVILQWLQSVLRALPVALEVLALSGTIKIGVPHLPVDDLSRSHQVGSRNLTFRFWKKSIYWVFWTLNSLFICFFYGYGYIILGMMWITFSSQTWQNYARYCLQAPSKDWKGWASIKSNCNGYY